MEHDVNITNFPINGIDFNILEQFYLMGDDVQKISIIQSLPTLVYQDSAATFNRIIPKIQQELNTSSSEYQIAASSSFKALLLKNANTSLLNTTLKGIDSKDPNVAFAWAEALCGCIPALPEATIQGTLLPFVKQKCGPNTTVASRIFTCRLIGHICEYPKLKLIDVKKDILPIVTGLCQDVSPDVRAAIGSYLSKVAGALTDIKNTNLLSSLVELAHDDNPVVRSSSIIAISEMIGKLQNDTKKQMIVPLVKNLCDRAMGHSDVTSVTLSNEIGKIIVGLENMITQDDILYFINVFKQLSLKGKMTNQNAKIDASKEVICRERCAANIVGMLRVTIVVAPDHVTTVYAIFKELAVDPCYLVRRAAASSLANIAQLLAANNKIMKNEIVRLLRDDAVEVLDLLVPSISLIFMSLYNSQTLNYNESNQATVEIGKALLKCHMELSKGYNWRLTVTFLTQLECLPMCMPSEYIHNNFTPMLLDKVVNGKAKPIRIQSIHVLVVFMRYNFKPNQSKFIRDSLIKQTAQSKSCNSRVLYVYVCEAVLEIFSEKFFKEFFLTPCLQMSTDKIPTVRWKFASFVTKLKNMVTVNTSDARTKQSITETISKLESKEKDRSVLEMIKLRRKDPPFKFLQSLADQEERKVKDESSTVIKLPPSLQGQQPKFFQPPVRQQATAFTISEQYFYIDAGVALDSIKNLGATPLVNDIEKLEISNIENIPTTNLTDDAKVNIREITLKSSTVKKWKRHSSCILSRECLKSDKTDKQSNRRSLNLGGESKIPIYVTANRPTPPNNYIVTNKTHNDNNSLSHLPILKRGQVKSSLSSHSKSSIQSHSSIHVASSKASFHASSKSNIQLSKNVQQPPLPKTQNNNNRQLANPRASITSTANRGVLRPNTPMLA